MNFVDAMVVRLADETTRVSLFDQDALGQILSAAYDADAMTLDGPYQPVFDELEFGVCVQRRGAVDARWNALAGPERFEGQFVLAGVGAEANVRVDALWRGAVVARTVPVTSRVETIKLAWPDGGSIDNEIIAALGTLPSDPSTLENERRTRFLHRVRAALRQPAAFSDDVFDRWLHQLGAVSVGDLLTRFRGQLLTGAMQLAYSASGQDVAPSPKALPIASAVLVRDTGFSIAQLLADSKLISSQLRDAGVERPVASDAICKTALIVTWIVPETVFDDADWPGGDAGTTADQKRALRRAAAGHWLAREGIGLVVTATRT